MTPDYSAELDLPTIFRGDTLNSFSIQLRNPDTGDLIEPLAVCSQIRDSRGKLVATLPTETIGGVATVGGLPDNTVGWKIIAQSKQGGFV